MKLNKIFAIISILSATSSAVSATPYGGQNQLLAPPYVGPVECDKTAVNRCPDNNNLCCPEERTCVRFAGGHFLCFKTRPPGEDRDGINAAEESEVIALEDL